MKKILLAGLTALNILTAGITISQQPQVVEKIVEVPKVVETIEVEKEVEVPVEVEKIVEKVVEVPTKAEQTTNSKEEKITVTYEKCPSGKTFVEFSDDSWAIFNHETGEYIFQPVCMGDWDMQFDNFEDLKMAMATYFEGKIVEVIEPEINQTEENETLNPEKYQVIEKELNKLPATIKRLLIDNGVEILIQDGILNSEEGKEVYGRYYWNTNMITMDSHNYSIEYALIHEIGHALDNLLDMRTEKIIASYENNEIIYENPHHNSSIQEYIAQGVDEYYKNTLNKNTTIYKELNRILGEYR